MADIHITLTATEKPKPNLVVAIMFGATQADVASATNVIFHMIPPGGMAPFNLPGRATTLGNLMLQDESPDWMPGIWGVSIDFTFAGQNWMTNTGTFDPSKA